MLAVSYVPVLLTPPTQMWLPSASLASYAWDTQSLSVCDVHALVSRPPRRRLPCSRHQVSTCTFPFRSPPCDPNVAFPAFPRSFAPLFTSARSCALTFNYSSPTDEESLRNKSVLIEAHDDTGVLTPRHVHSYRAGVARIRSVHNSEWIALLCAHLLPHQFNWATCRRRSCGDVPSSHLLRTPSLLHLTPPASHTPLLGCAKARQTAQTACGEQCNASLRPWRFPRPSLTRCLHAPWASSHSLHPSVPRSLTPGYCLSSISPSSFI
jgi:hypothetical protein